MMNFTVSCRSLDAYICSLSTGVSEQRLWLLKVPSMTKYKATEIMSPLFVTVINGYCINPEDSTIPHRISRTIQHATRCVFYLSHLLDHSIIMSPIVFHSNIARYFN